MQGKLNIALEETHHSASGNPFIRFVANCPQTYFSDVKETVSAIMMIGCLGVKEI